MSTEITIAGIITGIGAIAVGFWKAVSVGKELDKKVDKDICKVLHVRTEEDMREVKAILKEQSLTLAEIKLSLAKMNGDGHA